MGCIRYDQYIISILSDIINIYHYNGPSPYLIFNPYIPLRHELLLRQKLAQALQANVPRRRRVSSRMLGLRETFSAETRKNCLVQESKCVCK